MGRESSFSFDKFLFSRVFRPTSKFKNGARPCDGARVYGAAGQDMSMTNGVRLKDAGTGAAPAALWTAACDALRGEMGADTYRSWLGQASLRQDRDGALVVVTPTGIARDWIRRNAWRRIQELWSQNDPQGRGLTLKSKMEFEQSSPVPVAEYL